MRLGTAAKTWECTLTRITRAVIELFLDPEKLVVFGHSFTAGRCTSLYLTAVDRNRKVG